MDQNHELVSRSAIYRDVVYSPRQCKRPANTPTLSTTSSAGLMSLNFDAMHRIVQMTETAAELAALSRTNRLLHALAAPPLEKLRVASLVPALGALEERMNLFELYRADETHDQRGTEPVNGPARMPITDKRSQLKGVMRDHSWVIKKLDFGVILEKNLIRTLRESATDLTGLTQLVCERFDALTDFIDVSPKIREFVFVTTDTIDLASIITGVDSSFRLKLLEEALEGNGFMQNIIQSLQLSQLKSLHQLKCLTDPTKKYSVTDLFAVIRQNTGLKSITINLAARVDTLDDFLQNGHSSLEEWISPKIIVYHETDYDQGDYSDPRCENRQIANLFLDAFYMKRFPKLKRLVLNGFEKDLTTTPWWYK